MLPRLASVNCCAEFVPAKSTIATQSASDELESLRERLELDDCPHTHLFSTIPGRSELTTTKLTDQEGEVNTIHHVKIYGWNNEWARRHGLKPPTET